jgi:outer membrane protein TolC
MKRSLFLTPALLLILTGQPAQPQTSDSLTVDQAVRQVIERHPLVQQASEAFQASLARVEQSRSGYYPVSEAELGYTRLDPISEMGFPGLGSFQLFSANNFDEHISLRQTIYDFGKTSAALDLSLSNVQSATTAVEVIRTNLAYFTVQTFYSILFLHQSIQVQDRQIDVLNQHLLMAQKKVRAETATDFDVLTTQVRIAAAQNKKFDLQNGHQKQEAMMRRLLNLPVNAEIRLRGEFIPVSVNINLDSLTAIAQKQRVELVQAHDAERSADLQAHVASLRDMPALKVDLTYGLKNGYFPNLDVLRGNWVAAVEASVPIFNGYRTRSEEQEARANLRASEAHTRDLERSIFTEVQQAVCDVQMNAEKIKTSALQVEQAKEALAIATVRYESGVITNLDLLDA